MTQNEIERFSAIIKFSLLIKTNQELYWRVREQLEDPRPIYNNNDDNDYETLIKNIVRFVDSCDTIKNHLKNSFIHDDENVAEKANIIAKEIDDHDQTRA